MVLLASDYDKSKYLRARRPQAGEEIPHQGSFRRSVREQRQEGKEACHLVHQRRAGVGAEQDQQPHHPRRVRRRHGQLARQDHRRVPDDGPRRGQDDPRVARAHPADEAVPTPAPATPQQPVTSGNGAAAAPAAASSAAAVATGAAVDPELEPDPVKPIGEELDDEVPW